METRGVEPQRCWKYAKIYMEKLVRALMSSGRKKSGAITRLLLVVAPWSGVQYCAVLTSSLIASHARLRREGGALCLYIGTQHVASSLPHFSGPFAPNSLFIKIQVPLESAIPFESRD